MKSKVVLVKEIQITFKKHFSLKKKIIMSSYDYFMKTDIRI